MIRYWHGGVPGLDVGDRLIPPSTHDGSLGATSDAILAAIRSGAEDPSNYPSDITRVYLTTRRILAAAYAAQYPHGDVYQVRPDGPVDHDPDIGDRGVSMSATAAVVVKVCERAVHMSERKMISVQQPYSTWTGGGRMYDKNGYLLPSPQMRTRGITPQALRRYGTWKLAEDIMAQLIHQPPTHH